ncbi:MAG: hypothetical protein BWY02_02880 [bacterium ADurb.Bin157]|nr:MAG: hypothetical protein BWY02_02880 [bacterium ADurb.Bin157]
MVIRGLSGFGDAIYIEPLVRKEALKGNITLLSNYPDIFAHLPVKVEKFNRERKCDKVFSYLEGKANENTTQLADMGYGCVDDFAIECKPIAILAAGYKGMSSYKEFIPDKAIMQRIIDDLCSSGYSVLHITNKSIEKYDNVIEIESQSYFETVALFKGADLIVCQQGWGTALAEGLNKKCLVFFSDKIRKCMIEFVRQITPSKVCCKSSTRFVWDNEYKGLSDALK